MVFFHVVTPWNTSATSFDFLTIAHIMISKINVFVQVQIGFNLHKFVKFQMLIVL